MGIKILAILLCLGAIWSSLVPPPGSHSWALEKLKFGTPVKGSPSNYLPLVAAEEKGYWKENGLEVEWWPFTGASPLFQAVTAGSILVGLAPAISVIQTQARAVPVLMVAKVYGKEEFTLWVRADSPAKSFKELRGGRIGISRLGGSTDAFARVLARTFGMEKEIKLIAVGGSGPSIAMLKTGKTDAALHAFFLLAELKVKGEVRDLVRMSDYVPKEWVNHVAFAQKDLIKSKPDTVRRLVRALLKGTAAINRDAPWAMAKMRELSGYSEEAARLIYSGFAFSEDGRLEPKAIENIRQFLVDNGIIAKEKLPAKEELFTSQFVS